MNSEILPNAETVSVKLVFKVHKSFSKRQNEACSSLQEFCTLKKPHSISTTYATKLLECVIWELSCEWSYLDTALLLHCLLYETGDLVSGDSSVVALVDEIGHDENGWDGVGDFGKFLFDVVPRPHLGHVHHDNHGVSAL